MPLIRKNVIMGCVFGIEIGEHMPINSGRAAGHMDAVLPEKFETWIILIKVHRIAAGRLQLLKK